MPLTARERQILRPTQGEMLYVSISDLIKNIHPDRNYQPSYTDVAAVLLVEEEFRERVRSAANFSAAQKEAILASAKGAVMANTVRLRRMARRVKKWADRHRWRNSITNHRASFNKDKTQRLFADLLARGVAEAEARAVAREIADRAMNWLEFLVIVRRHITNKGYYEIYEDLRKVAVGDFTPSDVFRLELIAERKILEQRAVDANPWRAHFEAALSGGGISELQAYVIRFAKIDGDKPATLTRRLNEAGRFRGVLFTPEEALAVELETELAIRGYSPPKSTLCEALIDDLRRADPRIDFRAAVMLKLNKLDGHPVARIAVRFRLSEARVAQSSDDAGLALGL